MIKYKLLNNVFGWLSFLIAAIVYLLTIEPTTSFWDCGEYISTAFKLQVGHPPGAPFFQLLGRFFALFAMNDNSQVAYMINAMSAIASAFTILFLFWSITALSKKLFANVVEPDMTQKIIIIGSGLVGALAYTFSDTFWFSAVEGEVYAMSSFFTAITFWAILKWEQAADQKHNLRWIIFIAFLIGVSIGVHLLNLLAVPAVVFVYYFKKSKKVKWFGMVKVFLFSVILLYLILYIVIPWVLKLASASELFFVNSVGLPFNSGTIIYFVLLIGGIIWGIYYTHKKQKVVANTIMLALSFLLIGYSSFFMLVIRSNADTPIDENNPEDAVRLLAYLNREQYGYTPLLYGPYYNAPLDMEDPYQDGTPEYIRDNEQGKYVVINPNEDDPMRPNYDSRYSTFFPRMHSNRAPRGGFEAYNDWVKIKGKRISYTNSQGKRVTETIPTFGENLKYFFKYQLGHMYLRYFLWNFAGRQNDIQPRGNNDYVNGNWVSGVKFMDEARLGPQDLPQHRKNKAHNRYYFLPLLLGLVGMIFHLRKNARDFVVVLLLFLFTGIAIVIYLNQAPNEPRERDYAYAASFYAFAIWIGIGTFALWNMLKKFLRNAPGTIVASLIALLLVPALMASQNWDDHDRSNRYTALAMANNYLNSCAPNAILFTNGDNDTFPLWYAQEVEGIRTDIRVVNLSLLNSDWHIEQNIRKAYDGEPVPHSIPIEQYRKAEFNYLYFYDNTKNTAFVDLKKVIDFVKSDNPNNKLATQDGGLITYLPTKNFSLPVNKENALKSTAIPRQFIDSIVSRIDWKLNKGGIFRNQLMVLDILASNNWERPIYFAITSGKSSFMGLEKYFNLEGLTYRLVPYETKSNDGQLGGINTEVMYNNLMTKYQFGNANNPDVYLDENNIRMSHNIKNNFARLANALIVEGKLDSAVAVCDKCTQEFPHEIIPYNRYDVAIAEAYYKCGKTEQANAMANKLIDVCQADLAYFDAFPADKKTSVFIYIHEALSITHRMMTVSKQLKQEDIAKRAEEVFKTYYHYLQNK